MVATVVEFDVNLAQKRHEMRTPSEVANTTAADKLATELRLLVNTTPYDMVRTTCLDALEVGFTRGVPEAIRYLRMSTSSCHVITAQTCARLLAAYDA